MHEPINSTSDYLHQSQAANTIRAYASDWRGFSIWAEESGLPALPTDPQTIARYISYMAQTGRKASTISRHLVAIGQAHTAGGHDNPASDRLVRLTMQGIRRAHGTAQTGKLPILTEHLIAWARTLDYGNIFNLRNKATVLIGFSASLRRSEIANLRYDDVRFVRQGVIVTIRASKTDQMGASAKIAIPYGTKTEAPRESICPVQALRAWIDAGGVHDGALFRRISRAGTVQSQGLGDRTVSLIVKSLCDRVGLDSAIYGGHSLRAGHITQAILNGASEYETMRVSRHQSVAVFRRYIRDLDAFTLTSAGRLGL